MHNKYIRPLIHLFASACKNNNIINNINKNKNNKNNKKNNNNKIALSGTLN